MKGVLFVCRGSKLYICMFKKLINGFVIKKMNKYALEFTHEALISMLHYGKRISAEKSLL